MQKHSSSDSHKALSASAWVFRALMTGITTLALIASFIGAGLATTAVPALTTEALSKATSQWIGSPFSPEDMVRAAVATRDYTVGSHDRDALMNTIYVINQHAADAGTNTIKGAPVLPEALSEPSTDELAAAFAPASDVYVLTDEALSHLDDVYVVISAAQTMLIILAILALAGCIFLGFKSGRKRVGRMLITAGSAVLVLFAILAAWVIIDFNGFFAFFHSLFFASGTWTFSYESLLISMYPPEFWISMGAVWLVTTTGACLVSIVVGFMVKGNLKKTYRKETIIP